MKRIAHRGMSWESTARLCRRPDEPVRDTLGGPSSADLARGSANPEVMSRRSESAGSGDAASPPSRAARDLGQAAADMILICTNAVHLVADASRRQCGSLSCISPRSPGGQLAPGAGGRRLHGTLYTMQKAFYRGRMQERFGLDVPACHADVRRELHDTVFGEFRRGIGPVSSKPRCADIVKRGKARGANSLILGCIEIGLLVDAGDFRHADFRHDATARRCAIELSLASAGDYRSHSGGAERVE